MTENNFWDSYYEKATSTAIYPNPGDNLLYPVLGFIGECGEISNKIKKVLRDDNENITENKRKEIGKEIGDCLWYLANICRETDLSLFGITENAEECYDEFICRENIHDIFGMCLVIQKQLYEICSETRSVLGSGSKVSEEFIGSLMEIYILLCFLCDCLGLNLRTIAQDNIKKLLDRQKRDVLSGSGDDR